MGGPKGKGGGKRREMMMVEEGRSDKEPTLGHTMTVRPHVYHAGYPDWRHAAPDRTRSGTTGRDPRQWRKQPTTTSHTFMTFHSVGNNMNNHPN